MDDVKKLLNTVLVLSLALLTACQSPTPVNRGTSGRRMDPSHDSPAELHVRDLRSQDLVVATDQMAQDIAARPDINNPENPPRIFIGPIENETSRPEQNYQIFLNRLRAQLLSSGTRFGLDVRRERDFIEKMRAIEFGGKDPEKTSAAYISPNEYVLTAIVNDMPRGGTNYFMIEFQLVQLVDFAETGPGRGVASIAWSDFYEVKFQ